MMKKINTWRVFIGGIVAGIVFLVLEFIIEGLFLGRVWGVREHELFQEKFGQINTGGWYQFINLVTLFLLFILIIWVYAALRARFGEGAKTALITAALFYLIYILFAVNFVVLGIIPVKIMLFSLGVNLIELPFAVFAGASVYQEKE